MTGPTISSTSTWDPTPSGSVGGAGSPAGGSPPTTSVDDLFQNLHEFQWRGIPFPATTTDLELRQDLVVHKMVDRNGAYVEGTGRPPVQISAEIPFLNQIYPAANESWPAGALYPNQWRRFLIACLDGSSGLLVHPELGPLNVKLERKSTTWRGDVRGGVIVRATWVESDDTQADLLGQDLSKKVDNTIVLQSGSQLDANIATLESAVALAKNPMPAMEFTFDDLANFLVGVISLPDLLDKQLQGRADNLLYQANRVEDALERDAELLGPLAWPLFQDCERLKDAAWGVKLAPPITGGRTTKTQVLPKDMTVAQAAMFVGQDVESFLALNYSLAALPVIPKGTAVTLYDTAA